MTFTRKAHQTESYFPLLIKRNLSHKPCLLVFNTSRHQVLAVTHIPEYKLTQNKDSLRYHRSPRWLCSPPRLLFNGTCGFSPKVKRTEREAHYSTPSSVAVTMSGAIPLFPYILAWHGQQTLLRCYNSAGLRPRWLYRQPFKCPPTCRMAIQLRVNSEPYDTMCLQPMVHFN